MRDFDFVRDKYGPELLVDIAWATELQAFPLQEEPHRLRFYDIFLVTGGRGVFRLDEWSYPVEPDLVYFTAPGEVRSWRVRELQGLCLFFPADFLAEFFSDPLFLHRLLFFHHARQEAGVRLEREQVVWLRERLLRMRSELDDLRGDSSHLLRAILYEVLVTLNRIFGRKLGIRTDDLASETVFRFLQLLEQDFRSEHRLGSYCRQLAVSPSHLRNLCQVALGQPPGQVIRRRLATEARRLLRYSDLSAQRISDELGFADPSYFGRFIKRETGSTPSQLRRR